MQLIRNVFSWNFPITTSCEKVSQSVSLDRLSYTYFHSQHSTLRIELWTKSVLFSNWYFEPPPLFSRFGPKTIENVLNNNSPAKMHPGNLKNAWESIPFFFYSYRRTFEKCFKNIYVCSFCFVKEFKDSPKLSWMFI